MEILETLALIQSTRERAVPLVVALALALGGLLLLADRIWWRRRARALRGRIHGFLAEGDPEAPRYRAVVELTLPDGSRVLGRNDSSSTSLAGPEIGEPVQLLVVPESFPTVRIRGPGRLRAGIALSLAGTLLAAGLWTTLVEGALFLTLVAAQLGAVLWYLFLARRADPPASLPDPGRELEAARVPPEEITRRRAEIARVNRVAAPIGLGVALLLLGGAFLTGREAVQLRATGVVAEGVVEGNELNRIGFERPWWRTAVSFEPEGGGERIRFLDPFGSSRPRWRPGESVQVLYLPDPPHRARIDAGPTSHLIFPVLLALAGLGVLGMSAAAWRTTRPPHRHPS